MMKKINPAVDAIIRPIISEMTKIDIAQRTQPLIGTHNEPEYVKEMKKSCVHIIWNGSEYLPRIEKCGDGKYRCQVCGREVNTKFDENAVKTLLEANKIVNQVLFFGMLNGLKAEPIATLISIKRVIPAVAQILSELNKFVALDKNATDSEKNIGVEYYNNQGFRPITSM